MAATDSIIRISGFHFRYKKAPRPVFAGFDLMVPAGERLAVLGPSEAGKSTLALSLQAIIPRMIKGEFRGRVEVDGVATTRARPRRLAGRVGTLFQDFEAQLFCTRVDQEVAFGPENLALPRKQLQARVQEALDLVDLAALQDRDPATLSGGQKQLLALAAVLALQPRLLILDEPATDLDPLRVEELLATLDGLSRESSLTLLLMGADLRLTRHCDRVVLLDQGKVVADGPPAQVLREVETFRRLGLRPPDLPALFHDLGEKVLPLTLEEAVDAARRRGWGTEVKAHFPLSPALQPQEGGGELLALRRVSFAYPGAAPLFQDLSLAFGRGELTAILGHNGGGKTTLLKLLRGLLKPQAGEVWVDPVPQPQRLGLVFQNPDYQLFAERVFEEVAFGPRLLGLDDAEVARRSTEALERVHLLSRAEDDPFSLTKGQRQRLAVAGVLALTPDVIILDEPTTGLDHREQQDLLDLVKELNAQGHTVIMVTHSMWAAATYARRCVILHEGRVVLDGPTREVLAQEEVLQQCRLRPPAVVQLSRRLGFVALTPQEFQAQVLAKRQPDA